MPLELSTCVLFISLMQSVNTQIKGEKQLEDLTNLVKFMSSKFDE